GYLCINYWGSNTTSLDAQQGNWDVLGGAYNADETVWDALRSYGKPTWAAIVPNQAAYDQAVIDTDADFYMVRSLDVDPVGPADPPVGVSVTDENVALELAYLKSLGATGPSLADARLQIYGANRYGYFAAQSGLTRAS